MKSILSVAACQAMSLMIGCKPSVNSSVWRRQRQPDFDQERDSMKRRDFIKDSVVSAVAAGTHLTLSNRRLSAGKDPRSRSGRRN